MELTLSCRCGQVQGTLSQVKPSKVSRVVCYCGFCQSYERYLQPVQPALDAFGGTDMIQLSPAHIRLTQGEEQLACLKLTEGGALRYYAKCCQSALMNTTQRSNVPFISIPLSRIPDLAPDAEAVRHVGPIRIRAFVPDTLQQALPSSPKVRNLTGYLHLGRLLLGWTLQGAAKHSPLWRNGKSVCTPERIRLLRQN